MDTEEILLNGFLTEEELQNISLRRGYLMEDKDYLFLSDKSYPLKKLISIDLSLKIVSFKSLLTADSKINYFEGVKEFKIAYADDNDDEINLTKKAPFNGSFITPLRESLKNVQVHLIHGYFYVADTNIIDYYISYFLKYGVKPNSQTSRYDTDSEFY
ncbi:hypothetical protein [Clostridium intestinale]|uniref:Uncharacterized protein n=1 Tax=Clostridium intestinale DSM 6191 TaxID=1121320 RepID=A0A1M6DE68_9CLOT|nr:hypothetical protein [Clostridium intestinale]WRY49926.1 hypothetical protein P8F83_14515 [Clostridium intestinale]SHI71512.1 hypothetical protein SAMN02745941_04231 [Clostridium intestinale DSM 6191]